MQLHEMHYDAGEHNTPIQDDINLGELWQNHPKPLVAYGLHALPLPGWEKVCDWSTNEVYLLVDAALNWALQQLSSEQKGRSVEMVASDLLKTHGYDKTTKQCQEQWQYILSTFRRGGYGPFKDQINLIHVLTPSLIPSSPSNVHFSMSTDSSCQHHQIPVEGQKAALTSSPELGDVTTMHASKKRKTGKHTSIILTSQNEADNSGENSTSENIASFVQINVQSHSSVMKHSVQISTNEKQVSHYTEKSPDASLGSKNRHNVLRNVERSPCTSRQKSNERGILEKVNSTTTDKKSANTELSMEKPDHIKPPKDKVQVEILSIKESESTKLIECRTVPGISPARTFKLHFPANHPLPPGIKHLYIPKAMVHRDAVPLPEVRPSPRSKDTAAKSDACSSPLSSKVLSVSNVKQGSHFEGGKQNEDSMEVSDCSTVGGGEQNEDSTGVSDCNAVKGGEQNEDNIGVPDSDPVECGEQNEDNTGLSDCNTAEGGEQNEDNTGVQNEDNTEVFDSSTVEGGELNEDNMGVPDSVPVECGEENEDSTRVQNEDNMRVPDSSPVERGEQSEDITRVSHSNTVEGGEQNEDNTGVSDSSTVAAGTHGAPEKESVLELVSLYSQHCQQGQQRLHDIIEESHQQHTSALKEILSAFKELSESL